MAIKRTSGFLCGIPSLVGEGSRFYETDNLFHGAMGKFMRRYQSGGKGASGYWQKVCPKCRLLGAWVWFQGHGAGARLRRHIEDHYAMKVLGRDETLWAKQCQAQQKRWRGVASA